MPLTGLSLSPSIRTARMEALKNAIDAGNSSGKILFYTNPLPVTTGEAITTQTLLGTLTFSDPCGVVSNGVLTLSPASDELNAPNTGTIAFGRVLDSDDNFVFDGIAGTSGAVFNFNTLSVVTGGIVRLLLPATITDNNM